MPTSLVRETEVDVLVIGAGPAGLMCANALAKAGVNVRIIDKRPNKVAAGQADGVQPRTIEVFQSYGLADRLLREGNQMHVAAFYNPGVNGIEVTLHQGAIEAIFLDSMREMGVEVSRPMAPTQLDLDTDPAKMADPEAYAIRVVLKHLEPLEDGPTTEIVRAKFVVGTDGAHSWVRKRFDIPMEGSQTDYVWGVVDMVPQTDFPDIRHKTAIHSENGSCMIIPREGDKVRLYIQLEGKDAVDAVSGRIDKKRLGPYQLLEHASKSLRPFVFKPPKEFDWWTVYIIGQRVASRFSVDERVFIAGDGVHTHSPKAGRALLVNNNSWKLVYVLRGWAGLSLLKTYEFERRKYAQDLINFDVKFSKLFSGKPRTELYQDGVSHEEFLKAFQTFGGFTSGIGIRYQESEIVRYPPQQKECAARNVVVGQRMPPQRLVRVADGRVVDLHDLLPSNTMFKLFVFMGDMVTRPAALEVLAARVGEVVHEVEGKVEVFSVLSAASTPRDFCFMNMPSVFRPHWSKVLSDEEDVRGIPIGDAYVEYGIDPNAGAVVCVRPDGYVGMVVPLEGVRSLTGYFASFLA
ncbi:hypothetical protein R3P38DRAFT_2859682 [Favolaschia claudopus]|uniref:Phenol 2-monooxygenase n=1 Tax=Favolaschia claudopus TaxID=2862362 RepID=A0AAW0DM78_9AGAR